MRKYQQSDPVRRAHCGPRHDGRICRWSFATTTLPTGLLPIVVDQGLTMSGSARCGCCSTTTPGPTISFASGISVALAVRWNSAFAAASTPAPKRRHLRPVRSDRVRTRSAFTVSSPYTWKPHQALHHRRKFLTGIGAGIAGDFDGDGSVDAHLSHWNSGFGTTTAANYAPGRRRRRPRCRRRRSSSGNGRWAAACRR